MNKNLLFTMTLSGSTVFLLYLLIYPLANRFFSTRWKYLILKVALGFYLIPFAWYKFIVIKKVYELFPMLENHFLSEVEVMDLTEYILINNTTTRISWKIKLMWFVVFIICVISIIIVYLQLYKYMKLRKICLQQGVHKFSSEERNVFQNLKSTLGIKRDVTFLFSDLYDIPFTIGVFKPTIIVPARIKKQINETNLQYIIRHELFHIKNNDIILKFFALLLIALHWYNPICYIMYREICNISELYCDFCTTKDMDLSQRNGYCNLIVDIASANKEEEKCKYVVQLVNSDIRIIEKRILELKKNEITKNVILSCLAGGVICLAGGITSFAYAPPVGCNTETIESENAEIVFSYNTDTNAQYEIIPFDYFWTDSYGNITEISEENSGEKASCTHIYKQGVVIEHTRNSSNNGCVIVKWNAEKCAVCGETKFDSEISTTFYKVCIH